MDGTDACVIPLTRGLVAMIDASDYPVLSAYNWIASPRGGSEPSELGLFYAASTIRGKKLTMHRFLMGEPKSLEVDHVNGDGLDNRRCNLRVCTHQENLRNRRPRRDLRGRKRLSSRFVGVCRFRAKWQAHIGLNGKRTYLGVFETEEAAASAYDAAAREHFGEFARLNFQ